MLSLTASHYKTIIYVCTYTYLVWASLDFSLRGEDLRGWVEKEEKK